MTDKNPEINHAEPDTFSSRNIDSPEITVDPKEADWGVDLDEIDAEHAEDAT